MSSIDEDSMKRLVIERRSNLPVLYRFQDDEVKDDRALFVQKVS